MNEKLKLIFIPLILPMLCIGVLILIKSNEIQFIWKFDLIHMMILIMQCLITFWVASAEWFEDFKIANEIKWKNIFVFCGAFLLFILSTTQFYKYISDAPITLKISKKPKIELSYWKAKSDALLSHFLLDFDLSNIDGPVKSQNSNRASVFEFTNQF